MTDDGSLGVIVEIGIRPHSGSSWFWFCIAGLDRSLIALVDDEAPIPTPPGLELRAPGLWSEFCTQVAFDHFTFDLEAFGVELDDPADLLGSGYGKRVALGGELEWDTAGPITTAPAIDAPVGYEIPCRVHGELLIDDQTIEVDGAGWRAHWWDGARANAGFRGFDAQGEPLHEAGVSSRPSVALVPTASGLEHRLTVTNEVRGWWRG